MRSYKKVEARKKRRKENKKNKLKALVELSKLNNGNNLKRGLQDDATENSVNKKVTAGGPERKRLRKDVEFPLNGQEKTSETPPVFGELTHEQQKQVKKLLEQRTKKRLDRPLLELKPAGEAADLRTPPEKRVPLTIDDFQHFIIYSILHHNSTKGLSRWVQIERPQKVQRCIFLVLEGVGLKEYLEYEEHLNILKEFEARLEVATPVSYGGNLVQELALMPVSNTQIRHLIQEFGDMKTAIDSGELHTALRTMFTINKSSQLDLKKARKVALPKGDKFSRKDLLLSLTEMLEQDYPLPISGSYGEKFANFVKTRETYDEVNDTSPMWSVDCEMCKTSVGNELTRICILDEAHQIVYETLVKPRNKIVNYLTEYSGITEDMLKNITVTLEDVQKHISSICPPDVIFIGQSLNFDLQALKMIHPYVIDTSVIFNLSGNRWRKSKLSVLTAEFLSERIQLGKGGHSPIEDALAAMKLVQLKLQNSYSWGNAVLSGPRSQEESEAARKLLKAREEKGEDRLVGIQNYSDYTLSGTKQGTELSKSLFSHITKFEKNVLLLGKEELLEDWQQYLDKTPGLESKPIKTERLGVKLARMGPLGGVTLLHVSLASRPSTVAIKKADKLVGKLLKKQLPNTLYCILLAGRKNSPGNGLLFLHLIREHVPFVTLSPS